jgi:ATP/maltotriose-dependent transcriptional regulator MalT
MCPRQEGWQRADRKTRYLAALMALPTEIGVRELTQSERDILQLTAEGRSAPDIARRLELSPGTVKTRLLSLYGKLGVSDRVAAVAAGLELGLLD